MSPAAIETAKAKLRSRDDGHCRPRNLYLGAELYGADVPSATHLFMHLVAITPTKQTADEIIASSPQTPAFLVTFVLSTSMWRIKRIVCILPYGVITRRDLHYYSAADGYERVREHIAEQ